MSHVKANKLALWRRCSRGRNKGDPRGLSLPSHLCLRSYLRALVTVKPEERKSKKSYYESRTIKQSGQRRSSEINLPKNSAKPRQSDPHPLRKDWFSFSGAVAYLEWPPPTPYYAAYFLPLTTRCVTFFISNLYYYFYVDFS